MTLDPRHAARITAAIANLNNASAAGLSPMVDAFTVLDAIAELQADLRGILEAERRREVMAVAN